MQLTKLHCKFDDECSTMSAKRKLALCQHSYSTYTGLVTHRVHFEKAAKVTNKQMKFKIILSFVNSINKSVYQPLTVK